MRWAACFFVVRAEYQGASSMRAGTMPPPAPWGADRTNCPDKIRFAKSGRGWYNSYNCAAFCAGKVRS